MAKLDLRDLKPEDAAKALYEWLKQTQGEEFIEREAFVRSPEEDAEALGKAPGMGAWRLVWESGPHDWAVYVTLGGSMHGSYDGEPEIEVIGAKYFLAEPYRGFDIGFYDKRG